MCFTNNKMLLTVASGMNKRHLRQFGLQALVLCLALQPEKCVTRKLPTYKSEPLLYSRVLVKVHCYFHYCSFKLEMF